MRTKPFVGDFKGRAWNSQALFAALPHRHRAKKGHALKLMKGADFGIFEETHGETGSDRTLSLPKGIRAFWAHNSAQEDGLALWAHTSFLEQFNPVQEDDWEIIMPGRVAILRLNGALGSLDLVAVYLKTGDGKAERDARRRAIHLLSLKLRTPDQALTVMAGDWNFVREKGDRVDLEHSRISQAEADEAEHEEMMNTLLTPFRLHEIHQEAMTHCSSRVTSRIDRVYTNIHLADQLTRKWECSALEWCKDLSTHRPIHFSRTGEKAEGGGGSAMSLRVRPGGRTGLEESRSDGWN